MLTPNVNLNGKTVLVTGLWQCNKLQLEKCGLMPENIIVSGICTFTQYEDYFSARRLGIESGRIYTGVVLR